MTTAIYSTQVQYAQALSLNALEEIRSLALEKALRYRFDPTISRLHTAYLEEISTIIAQYKLAM